MQKKLSTPIIFTISPCSLGLILVAKNKTGICAIMLGDQADELTHHLYERFRHHDLSKEVVQEVASVLGILEKPMAVYDLPLDLMGTTFQLQVWQALRKIPVGMTTTYTDIAKQIHAPQSARAVAQACAANPLAIIVPCHRVIRQDGSLSGYRWGIERKKILLQREAAA